MQNLESSSETRFSPNDEDEGIIYHFLNGANDNQSFINETIPKRSVKKLFSDDENIKFVTEQRLNSDFKKINSIAFIEN